MEGEPSSPEGLRGAGRGGGGAVEAGVEGEPRSPEDWGGRPGWRVSRRAQKDCGGRAGVEGEPSRPEWRVSCRTQKDCGGQVAWRVSRVGELSL